MGSDRADPYVHTVAAAGTFCRLYDQNMMSPFAGRVCRGGVGASTFQLGLAKGAAEVGFAQSMSCLKVRVGRLQNTDH